MMEAILNHEEPITASASDADDPTMPDVDDPLAAMEAKLATLEGRLEEQQEVVNNVPPSEDGANANNNNNNDASVADADAANKSTNATDTVDNDNDNDDPMMAMFYGMEEKIEHLGTAAAALATATRIINIDGLDAKKHGEPQQQQHNGAHEHEHEHEGSTASVNLNLKLDATNNDSTAIAAAAHAVVVAVPAAASTSKSNSNHMTGKRKRGTITRRSPTTRGDSSPSIQIQPNQPEQRLLNEHDIDDITIISPQPTTKPNQQQSQPKKQQQLLGDETKRADPSTTTLQRVQKATTTAPAMSTTKTTTTPKENKATRTRINWAKSPHKERLHQILSDWFTQDGLALEDGTGKFISDYKLYATKVGISRTTLFKYIHKDPSKRKLLPGWTLANENNDRTTTTTTAATTTTVPATTRAAAASPAAADSDGTTTAKQMNTNGNGNGDHIINIVGAKNRGKRRLIDEEGVRFIVEELKAKADVGKAGFSRQEATNLIVERFRLTRAAASRQLSRHILPIMMRDGLTFGPDTPPPLDARDEPTTCIMESGETMAIGTTTTILQEDQSSQQRQQQEENNKQYQIKRSIVMSGVYTQIGRALFKYYYTLGHEMSACGKNAALVKELQQQCPEANLSIVDVTNDAAVSEWAKQVVANQSQIDLVIAADELNPEKDNNSNVVSNMPLWEIPVGEFDATIDLNVKGVANMIRHFVPQLISSSEEATNDQNNKAADDATGDQNNHHAAGGVFVALSSNLGRKAHPYQASYCASKFAIEGMMKSVAMSLPHPLCAVPLAPGIIDETAMVGVDATQKPTYYTSHANGSKQDIDQWVNMAGPMLLNLNRKDNGRSMSVPGFHTVRDRQSWIIQDGSGVA